MFQGDYDFAGSTEISEAVVRSIKTDLADLHLKNKSNIQHPKMSTPSLNQHKMITHKYAHTSDKPVLLAVRCSNKHSKGTRKALGEAPK
jgi:hypothetical protein